MENTDYILKDSRKIVSTLANLFKNSVLHFEYDVLSKGKCELELVAYDGWNGGTDYYGLKCKVPLDLYTDIEDNLEITESNILEKCKKIFKGYPDNAVISKVSIVPLLTNQISGKIYTIKGKELLNKLEEIKNIMMTVSTGQQRIQDLDAEYIRIKVVVDKGLKERNIDNSILYRSLWDWYGQWSNGSLPTYKSRREFLSTLFNKIIEQVEIETQDVLNPFFTEPTGWDKVDKSLNEIKKRIIEASTEEQYQTIGLLCREVLITLGQVVYDKDLHKTSDGVTPSKTDAKRMLEAYFNTELKGSQNECTRKYAKASNDLANELTHNRMASYKLTALCAEATNAVINIVAIISGRRDKTFN